MLSTFIAIMTVLNVLIVFLFCVYFIANIRAAFEELPIDVNFIFNAQMKDSYVFMAKSRNTTCNHCRFSLQSYNYRTSLKVIIDGHYGKSSITSYVNSTEIEKHTGSNKGQFNISCTEYKAFWLTWFNGHIQAGAGTVIGQNIEWDFSHPYLSGIPFPVFRIVTHSDIDADNGHFHNQCLYKASLIQ